MCVTDSPEQNQSDSGRNKRDQEDVGRFREPKRQQKREQACQEEPVARRETARPQQKNAAKSRKSEPQEADHIEHAHVRL
jgi:hypothetical protein